MIASAFLAELERAGVRLEREGEQVRYRTAPGVSIDPYRARIAALKPALLAALDWHAAVWLPPEQFNRPEADRLHAVLLAQEAAIADPAQAA